MHLDVGLQTKFECLTGSYVAESIFGDKFVTRGRINVLAARDIKLHFSSDQSSIFKTEY